MKKLVFGAILLIVQCAYVAAQGKARPAYFYGHVVSDRDTLEIKAFFAKNFIYGQGNVENIFFDIPVDENGNFHFELPSIEHIGRMNLYDRYSSSTLLSHQIVEPGDSIQMNITIHDREEPYFMKAKFSGRGAAKYECTQTLKSTYDNHKIYEANNIADCLKISDSILFANLTLLEKFRSKLSVSSFQILKGDIVGDIYSNTLSADPVCGSKFDGVLSKKLAKNELLKRKESFDIFIANINKSNINIPDNMLSLSIGYVRYLYDKSKYELVFTNEGRRFEFNQLYTKLRREFKGLLREKLLTYCFAYPDMYEYFEYCDAEKYTACLRDAQALIKTPWLKKSITDFLRGRGKGENAFNFILPKDSTGIKINLADFKGKVVLLDMWGYNCTACHLFANVVHNKIYPLFKNDSNFTIVSVMTTGTRAGYMRRLRSEGGVKYTFPEYINLFGGDEGSQGEEIEKYYCIAAWPFILLIDKNGKIYSSTVPFFINEQSPNVEKMIALITKALNEP